MKLKPFKINMLMNTLKRVISVTSRTTLERIQGTVGLLIRIHTYSKKRELEVTSLHVTTFESWRQNNGELKARLHYTASSRPVWTTEDCLEEEGGVEGGR